MDVLPHIFRCNTNIQSNEARRIWLLPVHNQKRAGDVRLFIPATGCLPMGSFCGTHGYGIIHPNLINASVMQLSYASTHADAPALRRAQCEPDPEKAPEHVRAPFDMMSIAPNFDLQLEACTAEETAKTIVAFDLGKSITMDRVHISEHITFCAFKHRLAIEIMNRSP